MSRMRCAQHEIDVFAVEQRQGLTPGSGYQDAVILLQAVSEGRARSRIVLDHQYGPRVVRLHVFCFH
jgi:hypothetical protein